MPQSNIMSWNLGGLNQQRAIAVGYSLVAYIGSVMQAGQINLIGFSGICSGLGMRLGELIVAEMGNRFGSTTAWHYLAGPPLGAGRDEQYLFVWNNNAFESRPGYGSTYWVWDYPLPTGQTGNYGFPRSYTAAPDMPPMTMFFKPGASTSLIPVSIFHAPDWSLGQPAGQGILIACTNISQIAAFTLGQGGLLMGTFNVPANDDVNADDSNGAAAFAPLAGPGANYTQVFNNQPNLLSNAPLVAMQMEDALVQTADNFFFRRDGAQNGLTFTAARVPDLLSHSLGSLDGSHNWVSAPLGPSLANIELVAVGENNITATADGSYVKLEDAFAVYRTFVSAYLPIMGTLDY